jgi:hypothetical protein
MSPARTNDHDGMRLDRLVRQIVLDIALLHYFASTGRRVAALSAIATARHDDVRNGSLRVLDFLEKHIGQASQ